MVSDEQLNAIGLDFLLSWTNRPQMEHNNPGVDLRDILVKSWLDLGNTLLRSLKDIVMNARCQCKIYLR